MMRAIEPMPGRREAAEYVRKVQPVKRRTLQKINELSNMVL
jgi:hypothetical protein